MKVIASVVRSVILSMFTAMAMEGMSARYGLSLWASGAIAVAGVAVFMATLRIGTRRQETVEEWTKRRIREPRGHR